MVGVNFVDVNWGTAMFHSNPEKRLLREHYAQKTRTLEEAAHAATQIAATEHLPIDAAYTGDPERWHREALLKTVPIYGLRERQYEQVPAAALINGNSASHDAGTWSELHVKGVDFQRYLDWLHSIW